MKRRVTKLGIFGLGLIAMIALLAFASRWLLLRWVKTADDPVQHEFVEAARKGDVRMLSDLLTKGAMVDGCATYDHGGITSYPALCEAISYHRPDAVRWLLDHGAQVNQIFGTETPLDVAEYSLGESGSHAPTLVIVEMIRARGGKKLEDLHR